jgi:hypothetical protein
MLNDKKELILYPPQYPNIPTLEVGTGEGIIYQP